MTTTPKFIINYTPKILEVPDDELVSIPRSTDSVYGYKAFTLRGDKLYAKNEEYTIGEIYSLYGKLCLAQHGYHFCDEPIKCFRYYNFSAVIFRIKVLGNIEKNSVKQCTNKYKIIAPIEGTYEYGGVICTFVNGKLHGIDKPALIEKDVVKCWFKDGVFHRENGPALEY